MWLKVIKRIIYIVISLLLFSSFIYVSFSLFQAREIKDKESKLQVHFLDVGQGDSIYIQTPYGHRILIDGGPSAHITDVLSSYIPFFDKRIDIVLLTHPHADHVAGLNEIVSSYKVGRVMTTGVLHTTDTYLNFLENLKENNIEVEIIDHPRIIELTSENDPLLPAINFQLLYPLTSFLDKRVENLNNTSIVARLAYMDRSFLFMGDLEKEGQQTLLETWKASDLKSDVIKVAHQGSRDSFLPSFLEVVNPMYAVIFAGKDNEYGHPHKEAVDYFLNKGISLFRTDENGSISFYSDGHKIEVQTQF